MGYLKREISWLGACLVCTRPWAACTNPVWLVFHTWMPSILEQEDEEFKAILGIVILKPVQARILT